MSRFAVVVLALLAACSPSTQESQEESAETSVASVAQTDPLALALTPTLSQDIGRPISLSVLTSATDGDWGWIVADPTTPEGAQIDWPQTNYADELLEDELDQDGRTYALLRLENGQWRVVEFAVGPTDVAWTDWPQRHGAPASLMQPPSD